MKLQSTDQLTRKQVVWGWQQLGVIVLLMLTAMLPSSDLVTLETVSQQGCKHGLCMQILIWTDALAVELTMFFLGVCSPRLSTALECLLPRPWETVMKTNIWPTCHNSPSSKAHLHVCLQSLATTCWPAHLPLLRPSYGLSWYGESNCSRELPSHEPF